MASTTPNLLLPYPQSSDPANPPADFYALAARIEQVVTAYLVSTSLPFSTFAGLLWYNPNTRQTYIYKDAVTSYLVSDQSVHPYLAAYLSTNQSITATSQTIVFNSLIGSAIGGSYAPSLASGIISVTKDGLYSISATAQCASGVSQFGLQVTANGVTYAGQQISPSNSGPAAMKASVSIVVPLTYTSTVSIQAISSSNSYNVQTGTNPYATYVTVAYLSPTS